MLCFWLGVQMRRWALWRAFSAGAADINQARRKASPHVQAEVRRMCPKKMGKRGESMKNVTLQDVAELAGVSQTTASLTLNHSSRANFRTGTRKRVLAAERQLGYRSSASPKRRTDMTEYMLLVLVPTLANPYYVELAQAIEEYAGTSTLRFHLYAVRSVYAGTAATFGGAAPTDESLRKGRRDRGADYR